jgi:mono/diheme cytochrome c family protein
MRNRKWYFAAAAGLSLLASRGLYADFRAGGYTPKGPETMHQTFPGAASTDATYDAGQYPMYYPELAAGDGKDEVQNNCALCHSPRYITMQAVLPAQSWADEVNKMIKTYGAPISEEDAQKIIHYLGTHYTPETRKR